MCDFDNLPTGGTAEQDAAEELRRSRRKWTLHQRNVGKGGNIITHWSSGPGNYTYDSDCWWCRLKELVGL